MNRSRKIKLLAIICMLCIVVICVIAIVIVVVCIGSKATISFIVDGGTYATIDTSGDEMVTIPQSPTKDGYTFDGWYWDNGTWQRPFTANSLLSEALTADMSVYAKFTEIHAHSLTLQPANEATCTKQGNNAYYTCSCGKLFADEQGKQELTAIPTTEIIDHTPTQWITDSEPTCTSNGSKHTECAVCHTTLQTETIPSNGHTPEITWKIDSNATCTVDGSKHLECSVCHTTLQTETIPSTGHTYSTDWTSDERGHWRVATCEHTSEISAVESHSYDKNYKCKVCNYQDTSLHGTAIATEIFDIDGETLYAKVPNNQTMFSFINSIQVADDATFVVATDLAASNVIRTKTVSLEIGDNTYYVLVENDNDIQLYTVTLRRRPIYSVTFVTDGGTACDSQQVEEDSFATIPTITKTGYTFTDWDYDFKQAITANTTIIASWTANRYTITYDVNGGELTETEYTVTYDSAYTLAVPTREGHTFQGWYIDETKITNANGQSLANWTYAENKTATANWNINSYTLIITNPNSNAGTVTGAGIKVYNTEVTVTATEPRIGYDFLGWYSGNQLFSTELTHTFNMPSTNLTLEVNYRVRDEMSNYNFSSTTTTCSITGVKDKTVTESLIPDYVTSIGSSAFNGCNNIQNIIIPDNVTSIRNFAFSECSSLTNVIIGNGVTTIDACAFKMCSNLTTVTIGNHVTTMGAEVFYKCNRLISITIPDSVTTIGDKSFDMCSSLTTVTIGNGATSIGDYVFYFCSSLTSVTIGHKITSIGLEAFQLCNNLTKVYYTGDISGWCSINFGNSYANPLYYAHNLYIDNELVTELVIPDTVMKIKSNAFNGCTSLTNVTIPDSVMEIGFNAFYNCNNLTSVYYTGDISGWCNIEFHNSDSNPLCNGADLYIDNECITELIIPDTVMVIKTYAFYGYMSITSVIIGNNTTRIGEEAFAYCSNLTSVTIGDRVIMIDVLAFYQCSNLTNITISQSVMTVGDQAFYRCSGLKSIYYKGTADDWTKINVVGSNASLTRATRYYYSETEPELNAKGTAYNGNYWYYNDNHEIVVWTYNKEND